jgi:hypothetical protein
MGYSVASAVPFAPRVSHPLSDFLPPGPCGEAASGLLVNPSIPFFRILTKITMVIVKITNCQQVG